MKHLILCFLLIGTCGLDAGDDSHDFLNKTAYSLDQVAAYSSNQPSGFPAPLVAGKEQTHSAISAPIPSAAEEMLYSYAVGIVMILLFETAKIIWTLLRLHYFRAKQKNIILDLSKETVLQLGIWAYGFPVWFFICSMASFGFIFSHEINLIGSWFFALISIFFLYLAIFHFFQRVKSHVILGVGNQMNYFCPSGGLSTVYSNQIVKYRFGPYNYRIKTKEGNILKFPTTVRRSELVMAFLEKAIKENEG